MAFGLRAFELDVSMGTWVAMVANGLPIFSSDSDPDPGYSNKWRQAIVFLSVWQCLVEGKGFLSCGYVAMAK